MKRINWELMRPEDIEVRPATTKNGKATLLLYQDSRNTMDALDRNFGEFGWQISYKEVNGQIYGCLSILNEDTNEWISKEDTGDESNISAQKGQSSDILKRCAVRFGYGRELYTAPKITLDDDGYGCTGYKVSEITYNDNREINHLVLVNRFGKETFRWDANTNTTPNGVPYQSNSKDNTTLLRDFCSSLKKTETYDQGKTLNFYNYYVGKAESWKGAFRPASLWEKWSA